MSHVNEPSPNVHPALTKQGRAQRQPSAIRSALMTLGSPKLTVVLLAVGMLVVLVGTVQQTRHDIHEVKKMHFHSLLVAVQFQEILVPAWFPEKYHNVAGGFYIPSGVSVIIAMLVNLLVAHMMRFRVQAAGGRLAAGVAVMLLGAGLTAMVIANGNANGFQDTPLFPWSSLWVVLQAGLAASVAAALYGASMLRGEAKMVRLLLWIYALVVGTLFVLTVYLGEKAFIGDDAMRVVWRLMQGTVGAIVVYGGAAFVFKRKAGIVVIHLGLLLLMLGELYTTYNAGEQRMSVYEGKSSNFTYDIERGEMAIISEPNGQHQKVVVVPDHFLKGDAEIRDASLPFVIQPIKYIENVALQERVIGDGSPETNGLGAFVKVVPLPRSTGASANDQIDMAGAYVQLLHPKTGDNLGVYLICQQMYENDKFLLDEVVVDGISYQIGLRFKHFYKPYSVFLEETRRIDYVGTKTAQTYSSTFQLTHPAAGVDERKQISMNKPLRYSDETFYQAGHGVDPETGEEVSTIQIVKNTGWMIPYVCCSFVGIGLFVHFFLIFIRFSKATAGVSFLQRKIPWASVISSLVIVGILGGWVASQRREKVVEFEGMQIDRLGHVPVVSGGRVLPLDSLARTTLRHLRKREVAVDANGEKQPAIRWVADVMFSESAYKDYYVFRIENPELLGALKLVRRKTHLFSLNDLDRCMDDILEMSEDANEIGRVGVAQLSNLQKRILALSNNIDRVTGIRLALGSPSRFGSEDVLNAISWMNSVANSKQVPLAVPGVKAEDWSAVSLHLAAPWFKQLAENHQVATVDELAEKVVRESLTDPMREIVFRNRAIRLIATMIKDEGMSTDGRDPVDLAKQALVNPLPEIQEMLTRLREQQKDWIMAAADMQMRPLFSETAQKMRGICKVDLDAYFRGEVTSSESPWLELGRAYHAKDAVAFNRAVADQLVWAEAEDNPIVNASLVSHEVVFNQFSPFYLATVLYVIAFVFVLVSWTFSGIEANRVAGIVRSMAWGAIGVAILVHTIGLVDRIVISGRPPITNLYSSALFIPWACSLMALFAFEAVAGKGIGVLLASSMSTMMLLAAYSLSLDGDTFSVLVAVLDTQFWLATHVICISLGYSASFVAAGVAALYVLSGWVSFKKFAVTRKQLPHLIYGMTCYALLLSFVGTVSGGLWADDAWGRFWGWDVKGKRRLDDRLGKRSGTSREVVRVGQGSGRRHVGLTWRYRNALVLVRRQRIGNRVA